MRLSTLAAAASALLLCVGTSPDAFAGNISVSNLNDNGGGSLRDAIQKANNQNSNKKGPPVIQFSKNLTGTISLTSGALVISADMVINGPGANNLTVKRAPSSPAASVFQINFGAVNISGLTISGGNNPSGGGGIYNVLGALTLSDCMVVGNSGNPGAGIFNGPGATIEVIDSTVANNTSSGLGGGICNGVSSAPLAGTLTLVNSTISDNTASNGGGIYNVYGSTLSLTNVTIAFNTVSANGGGIYNEGQVTTDIVNTIVAQNIATTGADLYAYDSSRTPPDLIKSSQSNQNSLGNNLIGKTSGSSGWVASDKTNIDPLLGPLSQNGGTTTTRALLVGSPAIDAGNNALALDSSGTPLAFDERGSGFPRIVNTTVDIGAYEAQGPKPPTTAREWKTEAIRILTATIPGCTKDAATNAAFASAISYINKSLDPRFWADDSHLACTISGDDSDDAIGCLKGDCRDVFEYEAMAIRALRGCNIVPCAQATVNQAVTDLITADALLAATKHDECLAGDDNERHTSEDDCHSAQGSSDDSAVNWYKAAHRHARRAVHH